MCQLFKFSVIVKFRTIECAIVFRNLNFSLYKCHKVKWNSITGLIINTCTWHTFSDSAKFVLSIFANYFSSILYFHSICFVFCFELLCATLLHGIINNNNNNNNDIQMLITLIPFSQSF